MSLTQFAIAKALPKDKPYKLTDGGGLHLLVRPNGSKLWHLRYRFNGQENTLAIGVFPTTSLANARTKREEARALLASGMNPSVSVVLLERVKETNVLTQGLQRLLSPLLRSPEKSEDDNSSTPN